MHNWLQDFAYRININWLVFVCRRIVNLTHCIDHSKFTGCESSHGESGDQPSFRVNFGWRSEFEIGMRLAVGG